MCGLAGVVRVYIPGEPVPPHGESIPEVWLDTLDQGVGHRGPDGSGRFRDRAVRPDGTTVDVALVHRRLSILDHAGGAQPMVHVRHADGSGEILRPGVPVGLGPSGGAGVPPAIPPLPLYSEGAPNDPGRSPRSRSGLLASGNSGMWSADTIDATSLPAGTDLVAVVFNGCLYDHRDLRRRLETSGHRFETDHADTEVFIHGWRALGPGLPPALDGMLAVLIWDRATGRLLWGRDRVGEKPLYLDRAPGLWIWSSSPAALATLRSVRRAPCTPDRHVLDWIRDGFGPSSPLGFENTEPGAWGLVGTPTPNPPARAPEGLVAALRGSGRDFRFSRRTNPADPAGLATDWPALLQDAVRSRLDADVPIGLFLSGGLDSALIAAIATQHRPDLAAFTVRMPHASFDESADAAETAAHLGLAHHVLDCDAGSSKSGPAEDLVMLIEQLGLPFGDSSLLPTYWVCRAAREHVKVALSGDGGDELFGGYRRHTINPALHRWCHLLRLIPDHLLDQRRPGSRSTFLARLAVAARHRGYAELLSIFPTPDLRRLLTIVDGGGDPVDPGQPAFQPVDDPLRHDFLTYLPDDLLGKTDTASMAVALEVRCPFLAPDLIHAAMCTPLEVIMPKNKRKGLLKQIARADLPDHVINRPKRGFAIPIGEWFRTDFGGLRQLLHDHLGSADPFPGLAEAGVVVSRSHVRRLLDEHDAAGGRADMAWRARDHGQRLYMLLVLSVWCHWLSRLRSGSG